MMKKTIILSILAFAVVSLSACGSDVKQAQETIKESAKNQVQEKVQQVKQNADGVVTGTIKDLMAMGQKQKCTWETPEAKGVVYVDGNKVRTQVTVVRTKDMPADMGTEVNSIDDGQWIYTWNEGMDTGTKMKSEVVDELDDGMTEAEMDMPTDDMVDDMMDEQAMNYKCVKWTGDKSQFIPPKNVKFQDMSEMMQNLPGTPGAMQQNMGNDGGNVEDACAMAPTPEEKAKCLEGMAEMKKQVQGMQNVPQ
jgi:hypothetical protein